MAVIAVGVLAPSRPATALGATTQPVHTVTFDRYSLVIDGRRTFIWSGELHPFRLTNPGTVRGGVPVSLVRSPRYGQQGG